MLGEYDIHHTWYDIPYDISYHMLCYADDVPVIYLVVSICLENVIYHMIYIIPGMIYRMIYHVL